jgi:peptide/nickel transport system permease protein
MGILIRIVRSSMQSALKQDFMQSAQAKGLPRRTAIVKYALRSAIIAPITVSGLQFGKLLGGTVVAESIFALPGIGRLLLTAVEQRDIILLQGSVLFVTCMVVLVSFLTDCLVLAANPTIRAEGGTTI